MEEGCFTFSCTLSSDKSTGNCSFFFFLATLLAWAWHSQMRVCVCVGAGEDQLRSWRTVKTQGPV